MKLQVVDTGTGGAAHGTIAVSDGDLTLDVSGDITLDADGADINFKDGGTLFGQISNASGLYLVSNVSDAPMYFRGNDGGSYVNAITIDYQNGGNVGIKTASPDSLFHIYGGDAGSSYSTDGADKFILENNDSVAIDIRTPASNQALIMFSDGTRSQGLIGYNHSDDSLRFSNSGNLERLRISSTGTTTISGNTGNADLKLGNNATYHGSIGWDYQNSRLNFATNGAGDMQFLTGNATRIAVFRSNGCTAFGEGATATNASAAISIFGNNKQHPADAAFYVDSGGTNDWSQKIYMGAEYGFNIMSSTTLSYAFYINDRSSPYTQRFRIAGTGAAWHTGANQVTSDERKKKNIVDMPSQWDEFKQIRWRNFEWKDDVIEGTQFGVIAQEVQAINPDLVTVDPQTKEAIEDGVEDPKMLSIFYEMLHTKGMKALQEAMERIEVLEAEVKALKGE